MIKQIGKKAARALKIDKLLGWLNDEFTEFTDTRGENSSIKLKDGLLSGFAMFSLKDKSVLKFNNMRDERRENLKRVYKIDQAPSDSGMRTMLDKAKLEELNKLFKKLVKKLRGLGVWKSYEYFRGHIICSVDGVHYFSSTKICCDKCMVYEKTNGEIEYRHYLLSGSIVHPDKSEVMPVIHEPIVKQDGLDKNDSERSAAKRLAPALRAQFPEEKLVLVEDALSANGPHIRVLQIEGFRYVINVKPKGNKYLFGLMDRMEAYRQVKRHEEQKDGLVHKYRYANDLPLNSDNRDIRVNFLEYHQIDPTGKKEDKVFSWITDFKLTKRTVYPIMRMGRSRWKVENETFNTLKNQAYNFEHNYGHGKENLSTVFVMLMMLAFFVDQIQQAWNELFQAAWRKAGTRIGLWERVRSKFYDFVVDSMEMIYLLIIGKLKVKVQYYYDSG